MIMAGKTMQDHMASVAERFFPDKVSDENDVECMARIFVNNAYLLFRNGFDREAPHRPYLCIEGECVGIEREDKTPLYGNVKKVTFDEGKGINIIIYYEFTNDELAHMVKLGMYSSGFEVPEVISHAEVNFPVYCDVRVVHPDGDKDIPVLFMDIQDRYALVADSESCGYEFGYYFEPAKEVESATEYYTDYMNNLDYEFEEEFEEEKSEEEKFKEKEETLESPVTEHERILREHYANIEERVQTHYETEVGAGNEPENAPEQAEIHPENAQTREKVENESTDGLFTDEETDINEAFETPLDGETGGRFVDDEETESVFNDALKERAMPSEISDENSDDKEYDV